MFLIIKTKLVFTRVQHEYFYITGRKYATNFKDKSIEKIIVISLKDYFVLIRTLIIEVFKIYFVYKELALFL